jgi:hypothetical protein
VPFGVDAEDVEDAEVAAAAARAGDGAAGAKFRDPTAAQSPRGSSRETHPAAGK